MNHKSNKINKLLLEQEEILNNSLILLDEKWWSMTKRKAAAAKDTAAKVKDAATRSGKSAAKRVADAASIATTGGDTGFLQTQAGAKTFTRGKARKQLVDATHAAGQQIVKFMIDSGRWERKMKTATGKPTNMTDYVIRMIHPNAPIVGWEPTKEQLMSNGYLRPWAESMVKSMFSDKQIGEMDAAGAKEAQEKIVQTVTKKISDFSQQVMGVATVSDDESGDFNVGLDMLRDEFKNPEATANDFSAIWREMDPDKMSTDGVSRIVSVLSTLAQADDNPGNKAEQEDFLTAVNDWAGKRLDPDGPTVRPDADPDGPTEVPDAPDAGLDESFRRMNKLAGLII